VTGRIVSVNTSERTGVQKQPQPQVELAVEHGIRGDAHAGDWHRQVSLLAMESIQKMRACGADVGPGAFGENVTTEGVVVYELPVGTRLRLGDSLCEVTQIGKVCHDRCAIFHQVGDCVMPREGIFVRVLQGGTLRAGDAIEVLAEAPVAESEAVAGAETDHV
jgi:MOSC domain-containing protein YiiM